MKSIVEIVYFGYGILMCAFIINWLGKLFGFKSWYDLFGSITFRDLSPVNIVWLIVVYPLLLGISIYILVIIRQRI